MTLYALINPGKIKAHRLSINFIFFISKYPGIIPPENNMVKSTRTNSTLPNGSFFLDNGYAVVAVNNVPKNVPVTVTIIVVKYPLHMEGSANTLA